MNALFVCTAPAGGAAVVAASIWGVSASCSQDGLLIGPLCDSYFCERVRHVRGVPHGFVCRDFQRGAGDLFLEWVAFIYQIKLP